MTLLEGGSKEEAINETKEKFLPTWQVWNVSPFFPHFELIFKQPLTITSHFQTAVCVWPFVQTVNFYLIPEKNRVPFVSVCSFMWTVFLAYMKQKSQEVENMEEIISLSP